MKIIAVEHPYLGQFTRSFVVRTQAGSVLIDTGLHSGAGRLEALAPTPVAVLCTHGHWDHIGGHAFFQQKGARVYVNGGDAGILRRIRLQWQMLYEQFRDDFVIPAQRREIFDKESGTDVVADALLEEGQTVAFGETAFRFFQTPGHSAGSGCILIPAERILFTGDTVCGSGFFGVLPQISCISDYIGSLDRLRQFEIETAHTAHWAQPLDCAAFHALVGEGLACCERLIAWTARFLGRDAKPFSLGAFAAYLCEKEGGKPLNSGACVTAAALLREYGEPFAAAKRCRSDYLL